ncbi:MAG: hypothetical protein FJW98_01960 [Actinobacteria bacterium]|nr:hypothetical protein [Actinomycetota bacterium]
MAITREGMTVSQVQQEPDADKKAFHEQLLGFVGVQTGPARLAPDEVNIPMIRHLVESVGDKNPIYLDDAAAKASRHGEIVAPPTMLQAWVMGGITPPPHPESYEQMNRLLFSKGFTSVVATNCEQVYDRYVKPGDRLSMTTTIDSISEEKTTGLGTGHFVTTRQDYWDADGNRVGSMLFRIIRFRPAAKSKPPRPLPATTHDNSWWFDALKEGKLLIQRCKGCGELRNPPHPMCASCRSMEWDSIEAKGTGSIHSYVVTHYPVVPSFEYPLPILLVDLDEGVRMVMNPIDAAPDDLQIGCKVTIEVNKCDPELSLPFARLAK